MAEQELWEGTGEIPHAPKLGAPEPGALEMPKGRSRASSRDQNQSLAAVKKKKKKKKGVNSNNKKSDPRL